jgi:hypothetical protein
MLYGTSKKTSQNAFVLTFVAIGWSAFLPQCGSDERDSLGSFPQSNRLTDAGADAEPDPATSGNRDLVPSPPPAAEEDAGPSEDTTACNLPTNNSCETAKDLGTVQGDYTVDLDEGKNVLRFEGTSSQWVGFRVHENNPSVFSHGMEFHATLESPAGTDFNLEVYMKKGNSEPSVVECNLMEASSSNTGTSADSVTVKWGDGFNHDDSKQVRLVVNHASGPCTPDKKWKLTIRGYVEP